MEQTYVEAILIWNERGGADSVRQWFIDHDFDVMTMQAGLLIRGSKSTFQTALGIDLARSEPPIALPVPPEISEHVASFGIPKAPRYH